ncbi:MAG: hypothetical protein ACK40G_01965 [Cytophagaceae bacterium]
MTRIKGLLLIFLLGLIPYLSHSQLVAPKYSNEFLSIGVGARAMGMSNVQVANTNDVTAGYWNPAGLLQIKSKYEGALMHSEHFAGIAKYDYGAVGTRLDSTSVLAVSVIRFGVDDIPDTRFLFGHDGNSTTPNYSNVRYFSASDYAFLISYAKKDVLIPGLNIGGNVKIIHRIVGNFANAWGVGLDAGAQYVKKGWLLGLMARDVTGTYTAWSHNTALVKDIYAQTGNEIPQNSVEVTMPRLIGGIGRSHRFMEQKFGVVGAADFEFTFDGKRNTLIKSDFTSIDPRIGFEADYKQIVFLRFGAGNVQRVKDWDGKSYTKVQPNFGLGIRIKKVYIDYALTNIGDFKGSLYSNVFSLRAEIK